VTPERWSRIREVFGAALETPKSQRLQFLESACGDDPDLRAEVERLLAGSEEPSWQSPAAELFPVAAEFAPGDSVAHYRIEARLGEGGMGVVYRAGDTRLRRSVALKFVKAQFSTVGLREARAVAALNHPNICTLHDVGPNYLVMELIEGPTLAERTAKGAIPLQEALDIARQIAAALEAADEKGIVHRDLKPANIKLTAAGTVKVLDFGLAKAQAPAQGSAEDSPTLTVSATQPAMILGTAAYMSPEQASGKTADRRADIWSFGAVLYEMLSGGRAFAGESVSDTLATVLKLEPDWKALPAETPASIRRLIQRCLRKDRKQRVQAIGDARIAIEEALSGALPEAAEIMEPKPGGARRMWLAWSMATLLAGILAADFGTLFFAPKPHSFENDRYIPIEISLESPAKAAWSPDGKAFTYSALFEGKRQVFVRYPRTFRRGSPTMPTARFRLAGRPTANAYSSPPRTRPATSRPKPSSLSPLPAASPSC
jgi:serine/threonine protein kinase